MPDERLETTPLNSLEDHGEFIRRHIGPDPAETAKMLAAIGANSLDELVESTLPSSILERTPLDLSPARSERETIRILRKMASRNRLMHNMIGLG